MKSNNLKTLIQTLSAKEKTVFKRYANTNGEGKTLSYVILFDVYNKVLKNDIEEEKEWNLSLKNGLKKHPKILKDLANVKKRLKEKILESLLNNQTSKNKNIQITNSIHILGILFDRKLYGEMEAKIKQLKKVALAKNWYKEMIEIIDWEVNLLLKRNRKGDFQTVKELSVQQQNYSKLYSLELSLKSIYYQMNFILESDLQLKKEESRLAFEQLGKHQVFSEINIEKCIQEKRVRIVLCYYKALNLYLRYTGQFELAYENCKKLLNLFEEDASVKANFEKEYIPSLCSFTRVCFRLQKNDELEAAIEKVKSLYAAKNDFDTLSAACDMGIPLYINTFQYNKAKELVNILQENWSFIETKVSEAKLLFYACHCFLLFWIIGDEENKNNWYSVILNYSRTKNGKGVFFITQLLNLTSDFDQRQLLHFDKKIETIKKTIDNNEHLSPFEKITLRYLKKLYNVEVSNKNINFTIAEKQTALVSTFSEFKTQLVSLKTQSKKFILPIGYEELMLWIESRIQGRSIQEVFEKPILSKPSTSSR